MLKFRNHSITTIVRHPFSIVPTPYSASISFGFESSNFRFLFLHFIDTTPSTRCIKDESFETSLSYATFSIMSDRHKLFTPIPEEKELSRLEIDTSEPQSSAELNSLLCCGIVLAAIDIFVIPISALILGISTIRMFQSNADYAYCPGNIEFECSCEEQGDSNYINSCSLIDDDWFAVIRVFAILYCCVYEGMLLLLQIILFLYHTMLHSNTVDTSFVLGVQGLRRFDRFNFCNFIARLIEFVWILVMVMSYLNITQCSCADDEEAVTYNDSINERRMLHTYCEVLMIFLSIYLVGTRVLKCCLSGRRTNEQTKKLWLEMYANPRKASYDEFSEPWMSFQSGLRSRSSSLEPEP